MNKSDGPMDTVAHAWTVIEGVFNTKELEQALVRKVEREMGIKIEKIERLSEGYFHAQLTDENVNNIERSEGQLLDFFAPRELDNLILSQATSQFISKHAELI